MLESKIARVEWVKTFHCDGDVTIHPVIILTCGCEKRPASHFSYRVGDRFVCHTCKRETR